MTFTDWLNNLNAPAPTPRGKAIISLQTDIAFEVMRPPHNLPSLRHQMRELRYAEDLAREADKLWLEFCRSHKKTYPPKKAIIAGRCIDTSIYASTGPAFTPEEDAQICDGMARGWSYAKIGREIGRAGNSVSARVSRANLKPKLLPEKPRPVSEYPSIQNGYGVSIPYVASLYRGMP